MERTKQMITQADLDLAIEALSSVITTCVADVSNVVTNIEQKLNNPQVGVDLSKEVATLKTLGETLAAADSTLQPFLSSNQDTTTATQPTDTNTNPSPDGLSTNAPSDTTSNEPVQPTETIGGPTE